MRLQSSVEFLLTYAWAFLSIAVFLAFILVVVTTSNPTSYNPATCYISPGLNCITAVLTTNSLGSKFVLLFTNNLGQPITFPQNALRIYPSVSSLNYTGNCIPSNAPRGATVICNATIPVRISQVGSQINPKFTLNYELCSPTCSYPVVNANTINTTGFATIQISPYSANPVVNITLLTSPATGQVVLNGVSYANNNIVYLINNLGYTIFALPPSGYTFNSWIASNGITALSTSTQATTLKATAKGSVTATFVTTTTSTTTTSTSTSTSTTTSTSTSTSTTSTSTSTSTTSTTSTTTSTSTTSIIYFTDTAGFVGSYNLGVTSSGGTTWIGVGTGYYDGGSSYPSSLSFTTDVDAYSVSSTPGVGRTGSSSISTSNCCGGDKGIGIIGLTNPPGVTVYTASATGATSKALSYTVSQINSFVIIAVASNGPSFSMSLPAGCSQIMYISDGVGNVYAAKCDNPSVNSYTATASFSGGADIAMAAYVYH